MFIQPRTSGILQVDKVTLTSFVVDMASEALCILGESLSAKGSIVKTLDNLA